MKQSFLLRHPLILCLLLVLVSSTACRKLIVDPSYVPDLATRTYPNSDGPLILIDEAHGNQGTMVGLFSPLVDLLTADGYTVYNIIAPEEYDTLLPTALGIIIGEPTTDFSASEVDALVSFYQAGGGILLISENPENIPTLVDRLGIHFTETAVIGRPIPPESGPINQNTITFETNCPDTEPDCPGTWNAFETADRSMSRAHGTTVGVQNIDDSVTSVTSFVGGRGIFIPTDKWPPYKEVLLFGDNAVYTDDPPEYTNPESLELEDFLDVPQLSAAGLPLGVGLKTPPLRGGDAGQGRIFISTNFEMFTAVLPKNSGTSPLDDFLDPGGFQVQGAEQNQQFVLNIVHWIDQSLTPQPPGTGQRPDTTYIPQVDNPVYPLGTGSKILYDHAHSNFHKIEINGYCPDGVCRYEPVHKLLAADGYQFVTSTLKWDTSGFATLLADADILMMANPRTNITATEAQVAFNWVRNGGSLYFIIDHPPNDRATNLANAFGLQLSHYGHEIALPGCNAFVINCPETTWHMEFNTHVRYPWDGEILQTHPATLGRNADEAVNLIRTFYGTEFRVVNPLPEATYENQLVLPQGTTEYGNDYSGWSVGMAIELGAGRIYVQSEAGSLTAQASGTGLNRKFGIQDPDAEDNQQYVLNTVHWLDWILNPEGDIDGDRVPNEQDNCTTVRNGPYNGSYQVDSDGDLYGNACDPDYDNNGVVGMTDFGAFSQVFGTALGDPNYNPNMDHNGDDVIDNADFEVFSAFFGKAPGPSGLVSQ